MLLSVPAARLRAPRSDAALGRLPIWQFSVGQDASIGFLRQAEIKHGRVAMAAFVGFIVQSNGIHWPWAQSLSGTTFGDISAAGGPADQWDALPTAAKVQILCVVGFLEIVSESKYILEQDDKKHYMSGGKPGAFPSIKGVFPHPVPFGKWMPPNRHRARLEDTPAAIHSRRRTEALSRLPRLCFSGALSHLCVCQPVVPCVLCADLYDPFGLSKNSSPEKKAKGLLTEINNGRLAMLGIMGFMAESKIPGSVPAIAGQIKPYSGEIMAPFSASDTSLPFVKEMLAYGLPW